MTDPNATFGRTGTTTPVGAHSAPTDHGGAAHVVPPGTADRPSAATPTAGIGAVRSASDRLAGARAGERIEAWTEAITSHPAAARLERAVTDAAERLLPPGSSVRDVLSGSWLGQSLHPILNDVPTGLWTSASVLDVISWRRSAAASRRLVGLGVLTALPTAASGLAELPKLDERGRRAAAVHAGLNLATLLLYLRSYGARRRRKHLRGALWALAGAGLGTAAGVLGGQLAKSLGGGARQQGHATNHDRAVDLDLTDGNGDVPPV